MQHHMIMDRRVAYFEQLVDTPVTPLNLLQVARLLFRIAEEQDVKGTLGKEPLFKVTRQLINSIGVWVSRNLDWFEAHPVRGSKDQEVLDTVQTLRWPLLEISRHRDWLHPKSRNTINSSCTSDWAGCRH